MTKNYDDFRAGMLRAAEMCRNEFKRAPEAAKGHDCVYMGGYEDACDHLSAVIAQAAVIDSVRIAGPQPDWQYHISLLLPDGIEDETLLKIYQVVEYELRAAAPAERTRVEGEPVEIDRGALCEICDKWELHEDGSVRTFMVCGACWNKSQNVAVAPADNNAESRAAHLVTEWVATLERGVLQPPGRLTDLTNRIVAALKGDR